MIRNCLIPALVLSILFGQPHPENKMICGHSQRMMKLATMDVFPTSEQQKFDISFYRLNLDIDPAAQYINGHVDADFTIVDSSINVIEFDLLDGMTVTGVVVDDSSYSFSHANDIILPKVDEWFPPNLIVERIKNQAKVDVKLRCRNGSVIDIKSHDQDIKVFEGSDYDWVWFDEPPPQAIFRALWRGLTDRRGIAFITGTPITEPWLFDLYKKAQEKKNRGTYWAQFIDIDENRRESRGSAGIKRF